MPILTATIATATTPDTAGPWTDRPTLRLDSLSLRVFPAVSQAVVSQEYGWITEDNVSAQVLPLDMRGLFVRVLITDGTSTHTWYGFCPGGSDAVRKTHPSPVTGAGAMPSGTLTWTIAGWEHFLTSQTLQGCYVPTGFLGRVLPFNVRRGRGEQIKGNRAAAPDSGAVVSQLAGVYRFDPVGTSLWTAQQALAHVLACAAVDTGIAWTLAGQTAELAAVPGVWDIDDGRSYADAIRAIANPELGWAIVVNGPTITVLSISETAIGYLPANPNVVSLDIENTASFGQVRLAYLDQPHYSTITVRGEPLRVMFTLSVAGGTLAADWDGALASAYAAEPDDAGRRQDKYRHLWSRFSIPASWDGTLPDGLGGSVVAFPAIVPATGAHDPATSQAVWARDIVLDRTLPPLAAGDDSQPGEPLVFVYDSNGDSVRLDEPPEDAAGALTISVCDDRPGILCRTPYRHLLASGIYSGDGREALYDYTSLQATVSAYTNDRVRITVDAIAPEPGTMAREKVIDIPGLHLWLVLAGTMTDVDSYEAADRYLRDDRATLASVAALARAWYGRSRASISASYADPLVLDRLGQVVSEVRTAGAIAPAGTMITSITYTLGARQSVAFATEHFDLDFARMYGAARTTRATHSRIARLEEEMANIPVRQGVGAPSVGGGVPLKITGLHSDSPTTGVRMYKGDVYGAGTAASATLTGVTVRIPGIAADVTLPSSGAWADVPACCGMATTATWTGATTTHTADTVYEAVGLILVL
ncbi:MAG: hypothetical protein GX595_14215 [Lentisphaerae bacterium]|nr:hypothetical protein [Lentisphaerota bacterium]